MGEGAVSWLKGGEGGEEGEEGEEDMCVFLTTTLS